MNPVVEGGVITAGYASKLSNGASASVLMESKTAEQHGILSLGIYRGMAVQGNAARPRWSKVNLFRHSKRYLCNAPSNFFDLLDRVVRYERSLFKYGCSTRTPPNQESAAGAFNQEMHALSGWSVLGTAC